MIKLLKVRVRTFSRKSKRMFKWRKPTIFLTKLPGEMAEMHVDFLERWNFEAGGGGTNSKGEYYETLAFSNSNDNDPPHTPYDGFEMELSTSKLERGSSHE